MNRIKQLAVFAAFLLVLPLLSQGALGWWNSSYETKYEQKNTT